MTPKKRWPNDADWARLDAIKLAQDVTEQTDCLITQLENNKPIIPLELSVRLARIQKAAMQIEHKLINAAH